ncbi:hypothetical protein Q31b_23410 [Novipirellula aureliae]|uniref:PEP-CTERM protein-sorting domain-containing protein n=1 Tax=Novipirellula aureliae TaxID=2527966 RepID=A0A5C6E0T7_9BACT|nr:PEP-CTERM sorting domain-containing protein [Novipirellula aureliae]TWU43303.1 hypothetical protein Q31b_23410 [Novipirellula aureliae]
MNTSPTLRSDVLNGRSVLEFDGNDLMVSSASGSLMDPGAGLTMFYVATGDQSGDVAARLFQFGSSTNNSGEIVAADLSTTDGEQSGFRFNNGAALYDAPIDPDAFPIGILRVIPGEGHNEAQFFVNGLMDENRFTGNGNNPNNTIMLTDNDLELILGTGRGDDGGIFSGDFFVGQLAELAIYDRALTTLEMNLVGNYFSNEYDLAFQYNLDAFVVAIPEPSSVLWIAMFGGWIVMRRRKTMYHFPPLRSKPIIV